MTHPLAPHLTPVQAACIAGSATGTVAHLFSGVCTPFGDKQALGVDSCAAGVIMATLWEPTTPGGTNPTACTGKMAGSSECPSFRFRGGKRALPPATLAAMCSLAAHFLPFQLQ